MEWNFSIWYFLTVIFAIEVIFAAGSCPNGKSGYGFGIKVNQKPAGVGSVEDSYRQTCDSDICCSKHCKAHNQYCSVALYDRVNKTCDLVCLKEEATYVDTSGITSLVNLDQATGILDVTLVNELSTVYSIAGGLVVGKIIQISATTTVLTNSGYTINLWTSSKSSVHHWGAKYTQSSSRFNTCTVPDGSHFLDYTPCQWGALEAYGDYPTHAVGQSFTIQLYAVSESEFEIKVDDSYRRAFVNRFASPLEDLAWLDIHRMNEFEINQVRIIC